MKIKTFPVKIKAAGEQDGTEDGVFEALVATYDKDSVGDKIIPGAFKNTLAEWSESGDPIPVYWSHRMDDPDYNIGHVLEAKETDEGLWVKAQLDLDSPKAATTYKLMKGRRVTQFSFAYDVLSGGWIEEKDGDETDRGYFELRELKLFEVGPTPIGANQQTELLDVKSADGQRLSVWVQGGDPAAVAAVKAQLEDTQTKGALGVGSGPSATSEDAWDGPAQEAKLSNDAGGATYKKAYAWQDPDGDPDAKASYKFIHHFVSDDGTIGAASTKACSTGIGVLNGGRGGTAIPDADRQGVYDHLAAHLRAADLEVPELAGLDDVDETGDDEDAKDYDEVTLAGQAYYLVPKTAGALTKAGRTLSAKNETTLNDAVKQISTGVSSIKAVLATVASGTVEDEDDGKASAAQPATTSTGEKTGTVDPPAGMSPATLSLMLEAEQLAL